MNPETVSLMSEEFYLVVTLTLEAITVIIGIAVTLLLLSSLAGVICGCVTEKRRPIHNQPLTLPAMPVLPETERYEPREIRVHFAAHKQRVTRRREATAMQIL
jgi:hypothetical protein